MCMCFASLIGILMFIIDENEILKISFDILIVYGFVWVGCFLLDIFLLKMLKKFIENVSKNK